MSTPESKLEAAAAEVSAKIGEVKSLWTRWEPYAIAVGSAILGACAVHFLKL
jgi:hypothetical protein